MTIQLSKQWIQALISKPETGTDYQVVSIVLKDGKRFDQVAVSGGYITQVRGIEDIPFTQEDIREIIVTHDKWNFNRE